MKLKSIDKGALHTFWIMSSFVGFDGECVKLAVGGSFGGSNQPFGFMNGYKSCAPASPGTVYGVSPIPSPSESVPV